MRSFISFSYHNGYFLLVASFIVQFAAACPGSSASMTRAKCHMTVTFKSPCSVVAAEIMSRATGKNGWTDPHNQGAYTLDEIQKAKQIEGSRLTGDKSYTDLMDFDLKQDDKTGGCVVTACSESQVFSVLDFSTNYCNLRNLYCNSSKDGCPVVNTDLQYTEEYESCWQRDMAKCISSSTQEAK